MDTQETSLSSPAPKNFITSAKPGVNQNSLNNLKPFAKGQSGNPAGSAIGKKSLKNKWLEGEITEADLEKICSWTKEEMLGFIKSVGGCMWGIAMKTPEEIAQAMKLKLAVGGLTEADSYKALPLMKEWFDRALGKAAQTVAMTVEDKGLGRVATDKLLKLAAMMDEPLLIAPLPKKLDE